MSKKVTFSDIARYTGFSKTTISRYFNNRDSLTLDSQKKIEDALNILGYEENKLARVLANGKSEFIGVLIPNLFLDFYAEMLDLILSTYEKHGYKFLVFPGNRNEEAEKKYVDELRAYKIEGLIVLSSTIPGKELAQYEVPVVAIEREDEDICSVSTDNFKGGELAAECLKRHGAKHLIHINTLFDERSPAWQRIVGFEQSCKKSGCEYTLIRRDFPDNFEEMNEMMNDVLTEIENKFCKDDVKGVFLANDTYACVFVNQIVRRYGKIPGTYKIIGFDNNNNAKRAVYPISTIAQKKEEMVDEALRLLIEQMNERKKRKAETAFKPVHSIVEPELIERETT